MGQTESSFRIKKQRTVPNINENDAFKINLEQNRDLEAIQISEEIERENVKKIPLGRRQITRGGTKLNILNNIDMYDNQREALYATQSQIKQSITNSLVDNNTNFLMQQEQIMTKLLQRTITSQKNLKLKTNQSNNSDADEYFKKGPNIFQKAIIRANKTQYQQFSGTSTDFQNASEEKQKLPGLQIVDSELIKSMRQKEFQKIIEKYEYINHWYRGPEQQRNEKIFVKGEKVLIIDDDEPIKKDAKNQLDDEVLGELLAQKIAPTTFILGDKMKILENLKAQEEKFTKEKKEQETKQLIKKSDVRMVIYPAYNNFFETSNNNNNQ